jgi:hypothetical protein
MELSQETGKDTVIPQDGSKILVLSHNIHRVVCLANDLLPLPKRNVYRVRIGASSCKFQCLLLSLTSFTSCLCLLPRLRLRSIFPSITVTILFTDTTGCCSLLTISLLFIKCNIVKYCSNVPQQFSRKAVQALYSWGFQYKNITGNRKFSDATPT